MNISNIKEDLKHLSIDFNNKSNKIKTEKLTLKHHTENVINEALKGLDQLFDIDNKKTSTLSSINPQSDEFNNDRIQVKCIKTAKHKMQSKLHTFKALEPCLEQSEDDKYRITKKYFNIWKTNINTKKTKQKQLNSLKNQPVCATKIKEDQIDLFIQNLKAKRVQKEKSASDRPSSDKSSSNSIKSNNSSKSEIYQNRYKAQRDIILMQKSKLLEQEQKIHELQFGKICDELRETYNESQNTIKTLLKKFSSRTKIVTGVRIVEEPEEVQMKINKVPKLVRLMEQRAQDRELKRQIIQERKRLIDEEKKRLFEEQVEKKRIQDEEEKKNALSAIKERRRKELEEEKMKLIEKEKLRKKCLKADKFYVKLLKRRAIYAFRFVVQQSRINENISIAFYETVLMRKSIFYWKMNTVQIQKNKIQFAVLYYENNLKRKGLMGMMKACVRTKQNMQVAIDYHAYHLQCKVIKAYYLKVNAIKIRRYHLVTIATRHYNTRLVVQAFYQWKSLPAVMQLERAKEESKRKWREKVLQVVPNYKPPECF